MGSDGPRRVWRTETSVPVRVRLSSGVDIGDKGFVVIAGPCAVESATQIEAAAEAVARHGAHGMRGGAYKPRSSPYSFQGLGQPGIEAMSTSARRHHLPVVTEVMDAAQLPAMLDCVDMLQIGARNMQNFSLLKAVGKVKKPVLLKRGLSATLEEWLLAAEYILDGGNEQVVLCERGIRTFEPQLRNTLDLAGVAWIKDRTRLPILVDPSHATGDRALVIPMALAAAAAGADGLLIEVHPEPAKALCDGVQALTPAMFGDLMVALQKVLQAVGRSLAVPGLEHHRPARPVEVRT